MRRVVVTGMGLVSPLACGVEASWKRLLAGESGIGPIDKVDVSDLPARVGGQVPTGDAPDAFRSEEWVSTKDQKKMDDFIIYGVAAAMQAIEDA
ncbi:MAG: beta-ketoacyl synthase N-terminal-like domain-containing protein, partial [Rickettsiales bacterium]